MASIFLIGYPAQEKTKKTFASFATLRFNLKEVSYESKASKLLRVKHTSRVRENLEEIRETIDLAQQEFAATVEHYRRLATRQINGTDLVKYVRVVFGLKEGKRTPAQEKQEKIIPGVVRLFENGRGSRTAGRNYWGAYNAVNEYLKIHSERIPRCLQSRSGISE
jgi:hypothetical protein